MKRSFFGLLIVFLVASLMSLSGCKKKTQPAARAPVSSSDRTTEPDPSVAAPTVELSASPSSINRGEEATISWNTTDADSVVIDGGVGTVAANGSVSVAPLDSTTYTATAVGRGGEAKSSARVTVIRSSGTGDITETDVQSLQRAIEEGLVNPVFFAYDSAELSSDAIATLEENSRWFRRYPDARIIVEGHCDERGTEEYNLALGDRRAQTAMNYLVQLGVSAARMESISFGEERPFVAGSTEAAWTKNRRAHFTIR